MKRSFRGSISILVAALLFIGALFIYSNLIKPTYADIKNKQSEKIQKEKEYSKYKTILEQNQQIITSFQNYQDLYDSILVMLPTDPHISYAVYQISGLASASNVSLKSISANESAITPSVSSLIGGRGATKISLKLEGSYESFSSFLDKLQNNIRLFKINSIRVEKPGFSNILDFNVEISAFYQVVSGMAQND